MALKESKNVAITGAAEKRNITAKFAVAMSGEFLPVQLIYGGKTEQSLPRCKFPDSSCVSVIQTRRNPSNSSSYYHCYYSMLYR